MLKSFPSAAARIDLRGGRWRGGGACGSAGRPAGLPVNQRVVTALGARHASAPELHLALPVILGGQEAVELSVYKEGDANTVAVAAAVQRRLRRLELPAEMKIVTVADQSRFIKNAIDEGTGSAWEGALLAVLVLCFLPGISTALPDLVMGPDGGR